MKTHFRRLVSCGMAASFAFLAAPMTWAAEAFDEFVPIIEINATDGDVGYHVLLDGPGWKLATISDSDRDRMFLGRGTDDLLEQGITELFMESAEPPCSAENADDPDEVVTLAEFLERFEAGVYRARGRTIDDEPLRATGRLTHNIPAAPKTRIRIEEDEDDGEVEVTIWWRKGDDLGLCEFEVGRGEGQLPRHPKNVKVVRWEVVVEPEEDELPDGVVFAKFTMQFPAGVNMVEVPEEYFAAYLAAGVTKFKGEVGAREASGNQTFTEFEFCLPDGECPDEDEEE